jgi:hypothetical protein
MKFGTRDFYENLQSTPEFGKHRTKISGTICEAISVFRIVDSDVRSEHTVALLWRHSPYLLIVDSEIRT